MDRARYWKEKYVKEHLKYLIIGLAICAVILFFIGRKAVVQLPPLGWVGVAIFVVAVDIFNFWRRMREYVSTKLMEEERERRQKDGFSTIPEDDPRYEDVD